MKTLFALTFSVLLSQAAFSQVYEKSVDFAISPAVINDGEAQIAFEYLSPLEFKKRNISVMDLPKMAATHPNNNQMIVSKLAFVSKKSFSSFSYQKMNTAEYIREMLNSVAIDQKASDLWQVTNVVKAYSIPMRVGFELKFKEVSASALGPQLLDYLKDEAGAFSASGRERFLILDMTNFTQLMYQNYSVVYVKEIGLKETLIVAGVVSAFNLSKANTFFNYPPFSSTRGTMMKNMQSQTLQMVKSIQD